MRLLHARVPLRAWRPVSLLALLSLLLLAVPLPLAVSRDEEMRHSWP